MGEVVFCNRPAVAGGVAFCRVGRAVAKHVFGDTKRKRFVERRLGATLSATGSSHERRQDHGGRPAATIRPEAERRAVPRAAPPTAARSIWQVRSMRTSVETVAEPAANRTYTYVHYSDMGGQFQPRSLPNVCLEQRRHIPPGSRRRSTNQSALPQTCRPAIPPRISGSPLGDTGHALIGAKRKAVHWPRRRRRLIHSRRPRPRSSAMAGYPASSTSSRRTRILDRGSAPPRGTGKRHAREPRRRP